MSNTTHIRITLDVTYDLNGQSVEDMQSLLQKNLHASIGNGLLTGDTAVEVDEYSVEIVACPEPGRQLPSASNHVAFTGLVGRLSIWDFKKPNGEEQKECECPAWGYLDSHNTLMELILQARALKVAPDIAGFEAATPKDCQDFFCIGADGNLWILGNHGDYEAANDTAESLGIDAIWLFGEDTAAQWMEKLATATAPSEVLAGDAQLTV